MTLPLKFSGRAFALLSEQARGEIVAELGRAIRAQISGKIEWAGELVRLIALVHRGVATTSDVSAFWVRLHGVLELAIDEKASAGTLEPVNDVQARMLVIVRDLQEKAAQLTRCFDDEELVVVEYERHRASHPFLDSYFLSFDGDTVRLRVDRRCALLQRRLTLIETRRILEKFDQRGAPTEIAVTFARQADTAAREYYEALTKNHDLFRHGDA